MEASALQKKWILYGAWSGILAALIYPILYYTDLSFRLDFVLGLVFSFGIGIASVGIFHYVRIHRDGICLQTGFLLGILAAFAYILSISIWHSLNSPMEGILVKGDQSFVYTIINRVHKGISFAWEVLIAASIFAFGVAFFRQPKPGKVIAVLGLIVALVILFFAFFSFPEKPDYLDLVGMGPLLPFWHLVVAIYMINSLKWIKEK